MRKFLLELTLAGIILAAAYTLGTIIGDLIFVAEKPVRKTSKLGSIVRLVDKGATFCTGTVISSKYILTAAHCVTLDSPFGPMGTRKNIDIRPSDNAQVGAVGNVAMVRYQMDQAILKGDFRLFQARKVVVDVEDLTILRDKSKLTACGYPLGGKFYCTSVKYKEPDQFFWKVKATLIPGMSGGPVFTEDGDVVATNVAVTGAYSIVSPTYSLDVKE